MNDRNFLASLQRAILPAASQNEQDWHVNIDGKQNILDIFGSSHTMDRHDGLRDQASLVPRVLNKDEKIDKSNIPENGVVGSGTRTFKKNVGVMANGLNLGCPVIVKSRDQKTEASFILADVLRS